MLNVFLQLEHLKKETGTFPVLGGEDMLKYVDKKDSGEQLCTYSPKKI